MSKRDKRHAVLPWPGLPPVTGARAASALNSQIPGTPPALTEEHLERLRSIAMGTDDPRRSAAMRRKLAAQRFVLADPTAADALVEQLFSVYEMHRVMLVVERETAARYRGERHRPEGIRRGKRGQPRRHSRDVLVALTYVAMRHAGLEPTRSDNGIMSQLLAVLFEASGGRTYTRNWVRGFFEVLRAPSVRLTIDAGLLAMAPEPAPLPPLSAAEEAADPYLFPMPKELEERFRALELEQQRRDSAAPPGGKSGQ
jgi:hypothetical protein